MKPDCFRSHQTVSPLCQKEPGHLLASLTVFFANLFRQNVAFFLLIPLCNKNFLGGEKNVIFYQTSSLVRGVVMTLVALGSIALLPSHDASAATTPAISDTVKLNITRSNGFLHPAISVDPSQFQNTRDELAAGKQPWTTYYQGMLESPYASTTFQAANLKAGTFETTDLQFKCNKLVK